jgi:hypothetical protein
MKINAAQRPQTFDLMAYLLRLNAALSCCLPIPQARDEHHSDQKMLEDKANGVFLCTPEQYLLLNLRAHVLYLLFVAVFPYLFCGRKWQKTCYCTDGRSVSFLYMKVATTKCLSSFPC